MSTQLTVEERLDRVERAVEDLRRCVTRRSPDPNWPGKLIRSMDDYPEFDEVVRLGREARRSDRPAGEE